MTVEEISRYTGLQQKQQIEALDDLVRVGFLSYNSADFMYAVERWNEKAGDSSRDRTRRFRERHRDVAETLLQQKSDGTDKEEDKEKDTVTLRVPVVARSGKGKPSERDLAAYAVLDALYPVIAAEHDLRITRTDWRAHNKKATLGLVDTGTTAEQAVATLTTAYTHAKAKKFYGGITTVAKLVEHWSALSRIATEPIESEAEVADRALHGEYLPVYR
jgi:hypothetical protein